MSQAFRDHYASDGPAGYYQRHAADYRNPHQPAVQVAIAHALTHWSTPTRPDGIDFSEVFDLAAGGGEATLALWQLRPEVRVQACDPYTAQLYERQTGLPCASISFEDLATGRAVLPASRCIVCSCALHLAGESWLPGLCLALAQCARDLLVITPLTRPEIRPEWGWQAMQAVTCTAQGRSVRLRWYRSTLAPAASSDSAGGDSNQSQLL